MDFENERSVNSDFEPDGETLVIDSGSLSNEEECELPNATIQDVFSLGHDINSNRFDFVKPNIIYSLEPTKDSFKKLKFVVNPNLDKTFLHSPLGLEPGSIGTWDPEEFSSAKKYKWVPKAFSERQPKRVPFTIKDTSCNDFFKDEYLAAPGKKLSHPTGIFPLIQSLLLILKLIAMSIGVVKGPLTQKLPPICLNLTETLLKM